MREKRDRKNIAAVILCGGTGSMMRSRTTHKVCFPILGEPCINRALRTYKSCGISRFVVVVGAMAGNVIETIGREHLDICYVYQEKALGTGHAARRGFAALERMNFDGAVLVTMGDKVIEGSVIDALVESFFRQSADLALAVVPKTPRSTAGRILMNGKGNIVGCFELLDLQLAELKGKIASLCKRRRVIPCERLRAMAEASIREPQKLKLALGSLWEIIERGGEIESARVARLLGENPGYLQVAGELMRPSQIERRAKYVNPSVYLFTMEALSAALAGIRPDHPGGMEYLTDAVNVLVKDHSVRPVFIEDPNLILGYNTPEELLELEDYLRRKRQKRPVAAEALKKRIKFDTASRWLKRLSSPSRKFKKALTDIYGEDESFIKERIRTIKTLLKFFIRKYGDKPVVVVRSPGRVNLMGRHVDHRGGHVNMMAIDREIILVASPRDDDVVRLANLDSKTFPDRRFSIRDEMAGMDWDDWLSYVTSPRVQQMVRNSRGDWSNYAKAAMLRLQQRFRDVRLSGMDCAVTGNVPMAAGLSSSSAVLVAVAEAAIAINDLDVKPSEFVDLCGEGEWFVGSRGGAADHAAIKLGRSSAIVHLRFFPFEVERTVPFPEGYRLVICNSHIKAKKSAGARDEFNQRIAAYEFGFWIIKDRFPEYAHLLEHLRDLNTRKLGITPSRLYEILLRVPERITRKELERVLSPDHRRRMEEIFATHAEPECYHTRSVVMFGLAEMERSRMCADLLERGDVEMIGELMNISHNGDRVTWYDENLRRHDYDWSVSDNYLRGLMLDLASEDPDKVLKAQIYMQPGGYACSTPEIDLMVDIARRVDGVAGAQLSGAGLGGCIMVLVREDRVARLKRALTEHFYRPRGLKPDMSVCRPISGAMPFPQL